MVSRARAVLGRGRRRMRRWLGREEPTYRYVFVVTYGRSGSTLVQGLLNTLPRTVVRGENNLYVLPLFRAMSSVQAFRKTHLQHNPKASHSAFYGLNEITLPSFVASTRTLVTGHLLGSIPPREVDVLGFKEVLWHKVRGSETTEFFNFLDRTFPECLYVLNERDVENVVDSGFWQSQDRTRCCEPSTCRGDPAVPAYVSTAANARPALRDVDQRGRGRRRRSAARTGGVRPRLLRRGPAGADARDPAHRARPVPVRQEPRPTRTVGLILRSRSAPAGPAHTPRRHWSTPRRSLGRRGDLRPATR